MTKGNRDWLDSAKKILGVVTGIITLITALAGFFKLWQGDAGLVTIALLVLGVGGGTLGCAYLVFKRTPPLVIGGKGAWQYPRWRRWALAGLVIIPLLAASGLGYHYYQQSRSPDKVIILIANFDGPEPQNYRVTETVLARLRAALEPYDDVQIEPLGRAITEAEGSAVARAAGEEHEAAIVIWGWYGATEEAVPLSVHFELLRSPKRMPELGVEVQGQVQTAAVAELESFTLQTRLSEEMAYLSLFTVGVVRYEAEDWDGAIVRFSDALSQTVELVPALNQSIVYDYRADAYLAKEDYDRAITDYDQTIQLQPNCGVYPYTNRGIAYTVKGDYDHAITDYDQAIQIQSDFAEAYYNRGIAYYYKGDYDRAIADYDQAIQIQFDLVVAYIYRGIVYGDKGDYDHAIANYGQAIQIQPDSAVAYYNRGIVYAKKGDYDRAIADFDQAIQIQPDFVAKAYANRGIAYTEKGNYGHAIADFDQAIQIQPDFAKAYADRGIAYYNKGNYDRAIADFDQAIQIQPDLAVAYIYRGIAYYDKGDYDRAIADYDQAVQIQPDSAVAYANRGAAYDLKGDYDLAIADLNQAIQIQPDLANAFYRRGLVYVQKGEEEKALTDFNSFLELNDDPYWQQRAEEQLRMLGE